MLTKKEYAFDFRVLAIHRLRVNVKSLAAEARIIRREESRCGIRYQFALREHRRGRVREEARYAQLALAFVRGRKYSQVEQKTSKQLSADRLYKKIYAMYGTTPDIVVRWLET